MNEKYIDGIFFTAVSDDDDDVDDGAVKDKSRVLIKVIKSMHFLIC